MISDQMAASQVKFWFGFLFVSTICWLVFMVLAWIISRIMGVYVGFRVGGWRCLRDVVVKFRKGAIISVSVGEIKLSLGKSLVKHGSGFISRDPKLQVLICDLEVVLRSSNKRTKKIGSRKSRSSVTSKKGKWMVTAANMAKFLSIVVKELVLKTPKATVELKELRVDISEDGGSKPALFFKVHLLPFVAHLGEPQVSSGDQFSTFSGGDGPIYANRTSSAPFSCEEFSFSCELSVAREEGLVVNSVEITSGEVALNLNEELFVRKRGSSDTFSHVEEANVKQYSPIKSPDKNEASRLAITKFTSIFPEKVCFNLPKLDVKFTHRRCGLLVENNIVGIELKSIKSQSIEDVGESTCLDVQLDFSEIHILRADGVSIVEILKLDVVSSVRIPLQPTSPIRSEIDVKLGGTQCNLIMDRLKPLMQLKSSKQKKMVFREESPNLERPQSTVSKAIMWTCTVSAPDMIIVLYNLSGMPLFKGGYQSLNVVADNTSSTGTSVHMDLGELNLCMADGCEECLKESLFSEETATGGSLIHIAKISLDWGKKDMDSLEGEGPAKCELTLSIDVTGLGVYLTFKRVESLISTAFTFKALMKNFSGSGKKPAESRGGRSTKPSGKGTQILKFNLDRCSIIFLGDVGLDNTVIADPKRVNYGSQGGRVIVSVLADGTLRTANVMSTISDEVKMLTYCVALEIVHFNLCVNKEKQSIQVELERARSPYQEYLGDNNIPGTKVDLLDIQNAKFIQRSGTLKDVAVCSLFSVIDITARWEPDVHIALFELMLRLKLLVHNQKLQGLDLGTVQVNEHKKKESSSDIQFEKKQKKKESIFAIDVETLSITGEAGDGVDAMIQVQSIFSENARIGVLLEGLIFKFNDTRIFRSSRMQISRVPKLKTEASTTWDWVIQALDVHVCMPYRLQLRAIDDSVEEMLRALKLITSAKNNLLFPIKKESVKPKKPSSTKFGCVRLCIHKLTIDIEEEPLQGWLDEHYQLIKNEARELAVRLNFLDELISRGSQSPGTTAETNNLPAEGTEIDVQDASAIDKMREEIYKQSFQSYYRACQSLEIAEGSGACTVGFQAGFKPSTCRTSLFSISATELDVSLTKIEGGDDGMIELLHKLDPICLKYNIPFSRLYGCNILLHTGSLVVQIRNYTYPLLAATSGKCEGRLVMAQQATCFQPQITQNVYVGRWRKVCLLRSASGTTPPMKTFLDLPLHFQRGEVSFGVGFEPAFADISYAFTVALRRANLSVRNPNASDIQPPKKEKSLPWWDEMRNYIHGNSTMYFSETRWNILATIDPYEKNDKLQILSGPMEIQQSDGRVYGFAMDFKILLTSLESLLSNCGLKPPTGTPDPFLHAPAFSVEVTMDWECESGNPLNHFLFALPNEGVPRDKIYDPFRSTSLSLRWNLSLRPSFDNQSQSENVLTDSPTIIVGAHDFAWLLKFWNMNYLPPQKLRFFSRWPRFGVPRIPRSGNLALDKVMTEFMFRIDSTPTCLRHMPLDDDDPAKGLTFKMTKLKLELCWGRGKQKYTFECKRELLDLVYQGLDLHMPKVYLYKEDSPSIARLIQFTRKNSESASMEKSVLVRNRDDGFFLSSDYFSIRKQAPKADAASLLAWQEAGRRNLETTDVRPELDNGSESDKHNQSDLSDDDGYNVVIADNCQRIFVYGLKLLWTIENRDAVLSWVGGISKAFQPPKPSPSRQYTQRKLHEEKQAQGKPEMLEGDESNPPISQPISQDPSSPSPQHMETSESLSSPSQSARVENQSQDEIVKQDGDDDSENEGTCHFMVNVIEPQFNLHSEEASGRFLLAAASGRVLARSFHSFLHIGYEVIEKALGSGEAQNLRSQPEMTWSRMEFSVMLEHVQAHVAPTDVDLGAGVQWLPKICKSSPKVKRTGALLERVFMPCDMYLRYTRHKGGTSDLKVKPLKELTFNSQNITATMTSRQFQVMLDVLINLLFARVSKPRKSGLPLQADDDEDVEEEADEVVPDGVEEVELAKVNLEQKEWMHKLILDDIGKLSLSNDISEDLTPRKESDLWMVTGGRSILVQRLKKELGNTKKSRKDASASLRTALQKAAQQRLMEKEKNKSPSYAMRISLQINKVAWGMLLDGKSFAEAEINDMIYDFDRDYKDIGVARFTTKYFVVRNCLSNAKSDIVLAAWNPPAEWGKKVMLGVVAKQGAPKDGSSPIDLFQVDIYPLKIHLTESMYKMMWGYFFQEEEQDSQWRQKVWKVSTGAASKRVKKGSSVQEASASSSPSRKELEVSKLGPSFSDSPKESKSKGIFGSTPELRRTSSFDRTWEETVAESVANELVQQVEQQEESSKNKLKDSKPIKSSGHSNLEEKKVGKSSQTSSSRPRKLREFHNIKISQVELLVTYEGARFPVSDLRLLMDTFHLQEYTGTWRRLFSRVKKHIIWGVLKSVTGMQGKKFKDKSHSQREAAIAATVAKEELNLSNSDGGGGGGSAGKPDHLQIAWPKRPNDGAGDGFVTSVRGLFHNQRRKAKAFVLKTMRGEAENELQHGDWSESDVEFSPFARQLTITKAKRLIRRHTKKFHSRGQKGMSSQRDSSLPSSPRETSPYGSDSSSESSPYEEEPHE